MDDRTTRIAELAEAPAAVTQARRLLRELTTAGGPTADTVSRAELALSEVVTNALTHGSPPVCVRLSVETGLITATVTDGGCAPMHLGSARPDDVHGRGLAIVAAVVTAWGWERPARGGRVVWFTVRAPRTASHPGADPDP